MNFPELHRHRTAKNSQPQTLSQLVRRNAQQQHWLVVCGFRSYDTQQYNTPGPISVTDHFACELPLTGRLGGDKFRIGSAVDRNGCAGRAQKMLTPMMQPKGV